MLLECRSDAHYAGHLQNPVPVEALYDRNVTEKATLTNLLQRQGYPDLETVLAEGHKAGLEEGLRDAIRSVLSHRGFIADAQTKARIQACTQTGVLNTWLRQALTASDLPSIFEPPLRRRS